MNLYARIRTHGIVVHLHGMAEGLSGYPVLVKSSHPLDLEAQRAAVVSLSEDLHSQRVTHELARRLRQACGCRDCRQRWSLAGGR